MSIIVFIKLKIFLNKKMDLYLKECGIMMHLMDLVKLI